MDGDRPEDGDPRKSYSELLYEYVHKDDPSLKDALKSHEQFLRLSSSYFEEESNEPIEEYQQSQPSWILENVALVLFGAFTVVAVLNVKLELDYKFVVFVNAISVVIRRLLRSSPLATLELMISMITVISVFYCFTRSCSYLLPCLGLTSYLWSKLKQIKMESQAIEAQRSLTLSNAFILHSTLFFLKANSHISLVWIVFLGFVVCSFSSTSNIIRAYSWYNGLTHPPALLTRLKLSILHVLLLPFTILRLLLLLAPQRPFVVFLVRLLEFANVYALPYSVVNDLPLCHSGYKVSRLFRRNMLKDGHSMPILVVSVIALLFIKKCSILISQLIWIHLTGIVDSTSTLYVIYAMESEDLSSEHSFLHALFRGYRRTG